MFKYNQHVKKVRGEPYDQNLEYKEYGIKPILKFHTASEARTFIQNNEKTAAELLDYNIITDYDQLVQIILNGINDLENSNKNDEDLLKNIRNDLPTEYKVVLDAIDKKKDVYMPKGSTFESRLTNTLHYLFYHMRSGIYCRIESNKIKQFIVFVNKDYTNNWSQYLTFEGDNGELVDMDTYYRMKRKYYRKENILDPSKWYTNAGIIDNEVGPNLFGLHLVPSIVDMLYYVTQTNKLKDTSFFINKRDHPMIRSDLTEPYAFMFPEKTTLPKEYIGKGFLPIHSFFSSEAFLDTMCVSTDDYDTLTGMVTLADKPIDRYSNINYEKYKDIKWDEKKNILFWRGSNTGAAKLENNQRMQLAKLSYDYNNNSTDPPLDSIINLGIVTFNVRDKKDASLAPVTFTRREDSGVKLSGFVPMAEQMKFKYHLWVEGHAAAARYMYLMKMRVAIFKVEPSRADIGELWFFKMLIAGEDYISIKKDLSDLMEKVNYAIAHDEETKQIAKNSYKKFRTLLSKTNSLKYQAYCINSF